MNVHERARKAMKEDLAGASSALPKPCGKTRTEFMTELMEQGMTLGGAMALADAAGKLHGYRFTHEQAYAVCEALAAARLALEASGGAENLIRADALERVNAACAAIAKARST